MGIGAYIGLAILALVVGFFAILLIRTAAFKPKKENYLQDRTFEYDGDAAVNSLAELVKCKTISYYDKSKEDDAEFQKLIGKLPELFPNVDKTCTFTKMEDRGILFKWKGTEGGDPVVLMAHYDVVPVEEANWTHPCFDAQIENGVMWGRGTVDTKNTFNGILSAAENLIKAGFTPKRDIYFAFSGGEEVNGPGAVHIVDYFAKNNITPFMVVDEGGAVVDGMFPGVKEPCGMIGIAEKGMTNIQFEVESSGGHASAPGPHTPVGVLSDACVKVESNPFKMHFTKPVLDMFDNLGRHSTFVYRLLFSNLWFFGGIIDNIYKKKGGDFNALIRTTVAFTQMDGSQAPNVIPPVAKMVANLRLNPVDTVEGAKAYIEKVIDNPNIKLTTSSNHNPSPISQTDCEGYHIVSSAVANTWKGCIVTPYLMVQCSDSRHYGKISDKVYRFSAADLTVDERHSIHGNDEHIRIETVKKAVEFFIRIMLEC